MKRKRRNSRGVTIIEMLIALLLLSLLTVGGTAAASAVMADYNHMSEVARAEILASTVTEAITNEVRLGSDFSVTEDPAGSGTGPALSLDSAFFGGDICIKLESGRLVAELKDESGGTPPPPSQVLSDKTYGGLTLSDLSFKKVEKGENLPDGSGTANRTVFLIRFQVLSEYGSDVCLWSGSTAIAPMSE